MTSRVEDAIAGPGFVLFCGIAPPTSIEILLELEAKGCIHHVPKSTVILFTSSFIHLVG